MKHFSLVCLITAILMFFTMHTKRHLTPVERIYVPKIVQDMQYKIQDEFISTEKANILMAFFTGQKLGIGYRRIDDLKKVNLIFLLSPSGLHLGIMFQFLSTLFGFMTKQKFKQSMPFFILGLMTFWSNQFGHQAFIRSLTLRSVARGKFKLKLKLSIELMVGIVFLISFLMGHYHSSPLSYVMSFAFIGSFISLRDQGKIKLILGLFLIQLIINLFLAQKVSVISIAIGLVGVYLFRYLFILILIYVLTFYLFPSNWIEYFLDYFLEAANFMAIHLRGSFTSSSIFLIFAMASLLFISHLKIRNWSFAIGVLLHTNTAKAPAILFL